MRVGLLLPAFGALSALAAAGCTALVSFDTLALPCDGGSCADAPREAAVDARPHDGSKPTGDAGGGDTDPCSGKPDGGTCGVADVCHDPPLCRAGVCTPQLLPEGTVCGPPKNECWSYPTCSSTGSCGASTAYADGYQWPDAPDDNSRCCAGEPVETTSVTNCGVCGIKCGSGQSCSAIMGYYFCTGCGTSNAACWSDCCSQTDSSNGHCSPSTCLGDECKSPDICPKPSHCVAVVPLVTCSY